MKTVAFNKPKMVDVDNSVDRWVGDAPAQPAFAGASFAGGVAPAPAVRMKRFTIDVPADLHRRIKSECAREGLKMTDVLREMLETRFPAKS